MPRVAGDCTLEINGTQAVTGTACSYRVSGENRTEVESMYRDGQIRYGARYQAGMISIDLLNDPNQDMGTLLSLEGAAMLLTDGAGRQISGAGMTRIGEVPTMNAVDGTTTVEYYGLVKEIG